MTDFIYAWYFDEDIDSWLLAVSEKSYFEEEGAMNDGYDDDVLEELELVLDELDCAELSESMYELGSLSRKEVEGHLRELPNFQRHEEFASFIGGE